MAFPQKLTEAALNTVTAAVDGSLLVTDDGSNSIWRISYVGE
jgi:glucose/arabinose dehydrogenase